MNKFYEKDGAIFVNDALGYTVRTSIRDMVTIEFRLADNKWTQFQESPEWNAAVRLLESLQEGEEITPEKKMEPAATIYGRKLVDKGGRLFIDGVEILKVRGMDLNKIGPTGSPIEVTLHLDVDEVDVRYSNITFLE